MSGAIPLFPLYHFTTWVGTTLPHFFYFISEVFTAVGDICWSVCIFSSFVSTNYTDATVLEDLLVPQQKVHASYPTRNFISLINKKRYSNPIYRPGQALRVAEG
jgi:hypothetical protein